MTGDPRYADEFIREHWKSYDAYTERKERVIEVTTTLYLGFVSALLLRDEWHAHPILVLLLWLVTAAFVLMFVKWQMGLHTSGARISNSCQTLMTRWLTTTPTDDDLLPEKDAEFAGVELPKVLKDQMEERKKRWQEMDCYKKMKAYAFEITVYGAMALWTVAFLVRAYFVLFAGSKPS